MIRRAWGWITRAAGGDDLRREAEKNQESADRLDRALRELLSR